MTSTLEKQHHAVGGGALRRLNFATALVGGVIFGFIAWALSHHFLDESGQGFAE